MKSNNNINSWESIVESSHKIVSVVDSPGFDKYTSNNLQGLLAYHPDYCILVVSPLKRSKEIEEQIKLAIAMNTEFCIAITHMDLTSQKVLNSALKTVGSLDKRRLLSVRPLHSNDCQTGLRRHKLCKKHQRRHRSRFPS